MIFDFHYHFQLTRYINLTGHFICPMIDTISEIFHFFFSYISMFFCSFLGMDDDEHQFDDIPVVINGFYSDSERSNFFLLR